jgi:hypothetical protein
MSPQPFSGSNSQLLSAISRPVYPGTYVRYRMRTLVCRVLVCPGLGADHAKPADHKDQKERLNYL